MMLLHFIEEEDTRDIGSSPRISLLEAFSDLEEKEVEEGGKEYQWCNHHGYLCKG